jgi:hypothetical protein
MVHQDAAHQVRRHTKEVRLVLPVSPRLIHQLQVRLADQRGGLERVALPFPAHLAVGDTS